MTMAKLFYIIGASGVGKDSLLDYARENLSENANAVFVHRYITRSADAGNENHVALSDSEFQSRVEQGCFAMDWNSHGYRYGIGIEVNQWLAKGLNVVMNGSRGYLEKALNSYPELQPVLIRVPQSILKQRLESRGRETSVEIEKRLERAKELDNIDASRLVVINNDGDLAQAGKELIRLILLGSDRRCA